MPSHTAFLLMVFDWSKSQTFPCQISRSGREIKIFVFHKSLKGVYALIFTNKE